MVHTEGTVKQEALEILGMNKKIQCDYHGIK